jgi:hypothetical protein
LSIKRFRPVVAAQISVAKGIFSNRKIFFHAGNRVADFRKCRIKSSAKATGDRKVAKASGLRVVLAGVNYFRNAWAKNAGATTARHSAARRPASNFREPRKFPPKKQI